MYINGTKVLSNTGYAVYEQTSKVRGTFKILELEADLKKFRKISNDILPTAIPLSSLEEAYMNKHDSYVVGFPSGRMYCVPQDEFFVAEEQGKVPIYQLKNTETDEIVEWNLYAILYEINRDRSADWSEYDETDWVEGLEEFTEYSLVSDEPIGYE